MRLREPHRRILRAAFRGRDRAVQQKLGCEAVHVEG